MYYVYMLDLRKIRGFEWDKGNVEKNYEKHGITPKEAEKVFLDDNLQVEPDVEHQEIEERFVAIGKIQENKVLFVVFTIRKDKVRVISARIADKKERRIYDKEIKKNTKI